MSSSSLLDLDPTGTLSAVGAGVSLVGAALRLGTAAKKPNDSRHPSVGGGGGGGGGGNGGGSTGPPNLNRSQTNPAEMPVVPKDPERERRAYETVNFVLRELGSRICAAGMVDEHALTKALTAATQHIEVNLFSGEANRLFESLAPKLDDPILVNSVFTSIYFIGALSAELATSLPNYKDTYTPVGPRLVQQLFRAAIGEDAFRDNLSANLDAYKTLTTTAGLLRPTDIGYATFPRFPAFSPCKYSSRGFADVRHNKTVYEKLVKHFERVGFPQPTLTRQVEVGMIRDWKFLWGDTNSRAFDVDKADKNIGENFGRVVHWLICNADRLPPGSAVIAYYDQHIELIKWIQHRMGYAVLYPATDLSLDGPHSLLEMRLRMTIESWVILMPSEAAQAAKRANAEHWMSTHIRTAARAPPFVASKAAVPRPVSVAVPQSNQFSHTTQPPPPTTEAPFFIAHAAPPTIQTSTAQSTDQPILQASQVPLPTAHNIPSANYIPPPMTQAVPPPAHTMPQVAHAVPARQPSQTSSHSASGVSVTQSTNRATTTVPTSPPMSSASSPPRSPAAIEMPTQGQFQSAPKTAEQQVEEIDQQFQSALVPQFQRLWSYPSTDAGIRDSQCKVLDHTLERETIARLDRIELGENSTARLQRKKLIDQAQELMDFLPTYKELGPTATHGRPLPTALHNFTQQMNANNTARSPAPQEPQNAANFLPPHSPESTRPAESNVSSLNNPLSENSKPTTARRKAPPPPRKFITAKALYDFEPDADHEEELGFNEDDEIEIVEKTAAMDEDGWCRARVKGSKRIGLVPLEYLKIEEKKAASAPAPTKQNSQIVPPGGVPNAQNSSRAIAMTGNSTMPNQVLGHQSSRMPIHPSPAYQSSGMPINSSPVHQAGIPTRPSSVNQPSITHVHPPSMHHIPQPSSAYPQIATNPPRPMSHGTQVHSQPAAASAKVNSPLPVPQGASHSVSSSSTPITNIKSAKANTAGLTAAAVGTISGVGALLKGVGKLEGEKKHSHAAGPSSYLSNQSQQSNYIAGGQSAIIGNSGGTVIVRDSPPIMDLSAFGEAPFDPRNAAAAQDQYYVPQETFAEKTTEADFIATSSINQNGRSSTTNVFQDTSTTSFVDGPGPASSPFSSLATTSTTDTTTYTNTTLTTGGGVTSTYESFSDDQTYSVDDTCNDNDYGSD